MPAFPRSELEEMVQLWITANRDAEAAGAGDGNQVGERLLRLLGEETP